MVIVPIVIDRFIDDKTLHWIVVGIFFALLFSFLIRLIVIIYKSHRERSIPHPTKGKIGIIFSVFSQRANDNEFFQNSFFNEFKNEIEQDNLDIQILLLPQKLSQKYKRRKIDESAFAKKQILFLLQYDLKSDRDHCRFILNHNITDKHISDQAKQTIDIELNKLFNFIKKVDFELAQNIASLEKYKIDINILCKYCIGLTLYLSGSFQKANDYFLGLKSTIEQNELAYNKDIGPIYRSTYRRLAEVNYFEFRKRYMNYEMSDYIKNYTEIDNLLNRVDLCYRYCNNIFQQEYLISKARHIFIYLCKNNTTYSKADYQSLLATNNQLRILQQNNTIYGSAIINDLFFAAFEDSPITKINKKFERLFLSYNMSNAKLSPIIIFIENTLEYFPSKHKLHYLLGRYYSKFGDNVLAKKNFDVYRQFAPQNEHAHIDRLLLELGECTEK